MRTLVLGLVLAACGSERGSHGTEAVGSCDHRNATDDGGLFGSVAGTCYEYDGTKDTVQGYSTNCGMGGTWSNQPCSHDNALGGCEIFALGIYATTWYYRPQFTDAQASQKYCSGTWLSP